MKNKIYSVETIMQETARTSKFQDIILNMWKKGFHFSALSAWNSIPLSIREMPTLPQFKRDLKTRLKRWINMKHDSLEEQQIGPNSFHFVSLYILFHTVDCNFYFVWFSVLKWFCVINNLIWNMNDKQDIQRTLFCKAGIGGDAALGVCKEYKQCKKIADLISR